MSSDSDPAQASSQQQQSPQQHQQDHMYSQMSHHPPMGSMTLGPPMGMGVASCSGGMMPGVPAAPQDSLVPKFPPQNFDVPDITLSNSLTATSESEGFQDSVGGVMSQPGSLFENILSSSSSSMETSSLQMPPPQTVPMQPPQQGGRQGALTTINQSQVAGQLGFQSMRTTVSPSGSSPAQESSEDSDDSLPLAQLVNLKRAAAGVNVTPVSVSSESSGPKEAAAPAKAAPSPVKRQRGGKKKKKKDPNEPQKPVSAYSLFFRDTQSSIKQENPSASFGEVSRIVASMWDSLDPNLKEVYKKRTEVAKKEYLKQLAAYRASQVSQSAAEEASAPAVVEKSPSPPSVQNVTISPPPAQPPTTAASVQQMQQQQQMQHMQQQQHLQQQQMQMQQTASQPMMHRSPPPHYSNAGVSQGEMNLPSYQPELSPPQQPQMDPVLSAAHDSGLFPSNSMHQSPSGLNMLCVRDGCQNMAVENPGWDAEYCSNECVVTHCRDIFTAWVAARGGGSTFPVK